MSDADEPNTATHISHLLCRAFFLLFFVVLPVLERSRLEFSKSTVGAAGLWQFGAEYLTCSADDDPVSCFLFCLKRNK